MKPLFSEEFYRERWDRFLEKVPGEDYRNLEAELSNAMKIFEDAGVSDDALDVIRKIEAKRIADSCHELVLKEMKIVKDVEAGKASFGMTTRRQEIEVRGQFRKRFEFNCLQLKYFKEKYL